MEIDFDRYKTKTKAPAHRFQEMVLDAFNFYGIEKKWQGFVWGTIRNAKKAGASDDFICYQLTRADQMTKSKKLDNPDKYFIKLFKIFLQ